MPYHMRMNDIFPEWKIGKGIFYYLSTFTPPWVSTINSLELDLIYHGGNSGWKIPSPFVRNIISDEIILDTDRDNIAACAMALNGDNWKRMWDALQIEYKAIDNYSMEEKMTDNKTVRTYGKSTTRTDDLSHAHTGTDTRTPSITVTTDNSVYGFNSATPSPSSKVVDTTTGNDSTEYGNTLKDTGTVTNTDSGEDSDTNNYTLKRSGNIGVTTSQQMLESEYELRKKNYFSNVVFRDLDTLLTLQIY